MTDGGFIAIIERVATGSKSYSTMPEKFWIHYFKSDSDRMRIHFLTQKGNVKSIGVIQYEAYIDDKWREIVRFDEAHGFFHRDVMSPGEKQKKYIVPVINKNAALTEAITHIKEFWPTYRKFYEEKYYEKN